MHLLLLQVQVVVKAFSSEASQAAVGTARKCELPTGHWELLKLLGKFELLTHLTNHSMV